MMLPGFPIYIFAPDTPIFETELTGLLLLSMEPLVSTLLKKAASFFSVGGKRTASRHYFLKETDGSCATKGSQVMVVSSGQEMNKKQNNYRPSSSAG